MNFIWSKAKIKKMTRFTPYYPILVNFVPSRRKRSNKTSKKHFGYAPLGFLKVAGS